MDILMKMSKKTGGGSNLESWDDEEEKYYLRGKKPKEEPIYVYFVEKGQITGRVHYIDYRYEEGEENVQGEKWSGNVFVLKGPLIKPPRPIEVPKDIIKGRWLWRKINYDIKKKINLDF